MLAGRMKLNTFLLLVGAAVGASVAGGAAFLVLREPAPPAHVVEAPASAPTPATRIADAPPPPAAPQAPAPAPDVSSAPAPAVSSDAAVGASARAPAGAREVDAVVLSYIGKDLGSDKRKDVTKGKPYKVNVYQDAGKPTANRAKVDLDRDDKWDEKFTFEEGGKVTRQVAPNDDEAYSLEFRWSGEDWVAGG